MNKDEKRRAKAICLDDWEKQIIYGALLGNAFLVDPPRGLHCYLVVRQSKKADAKSFFYKTGELKAFSRQVPFYEDKNDWRWTSVAHQDFDVFRNFCYKNEKKHVTMEWLNLLRDVSLMVWYLDRGFFNKGKVGLNIVNVKESEQIIMQFFNEVGMPCRLEKKKIVFTDEGTKSFLKVIAHRVPEQLHYRLKESENQTK